MNTNQLWAETLLQHGTTKPAYKLDNWACYRNNNAIPGDEEDEEEAEARTPGNKRPISEISEYCEDRFRVNLRNEASDIFSEERPCKRVTRNVVLTTKYVPSASLENLPTNVRRHALLFLDPGSMTRYGAVSKDCHKESQDETLPNHFNAGFEMHIKPGELMADFLPCLVDTFRTVRKSWKRLALLGVHNLILREVVWDDIQPTKELWAALGIDHRSSDEEERVVNLVSEEHSKRSTRRQLKRIGIQRAPALRAIVAALEFLRGAGNEALKTWFQILFLHGDIVIGAQGIGAVLQFKGDGRKQVGPSRR